jgi:hypothetical protein
MMIRLKNMFSELSAFGNLVIHIVLRCPKEQMGRVHARRIVATMTDHHANRDLTIMNNPRNTVGFKGLSVIFNFPISSIIGTSPNPTGVRFVDVFPKTGFKRWVSTIKATVFSVTNFYFIRVCLEFSSTTKASLSDSLGNIKFIARERTKSSTFFNLMEFFYKLFMAISTFENCSPSFRKAITFSAAKKSISSFDCRGLGLKLFTTLKTLKRNHKSLLVGLLFGKSSRMVNKEPSFRARYPIWTERIIPCS